MKLGWVASEYQGLFSPPPRHWDYKHGPLPLTFLLIHEFWESSSMFASTLLSHSPQHQFLILLGIFPVTPSEHLLVLCVAPPWEPYCLCRR